MKFMLFLILPILLISCTATSTEQIERTRQTSNAQPVLQQLSEQQKGLQVQRYVDGSPASEEPKASSGMEVQKPLSRGEEGIKLAEPAPETLLRRFPGSGGRDDTASSPKRQPWGGIWRAPLNLPSPSVGDKSASQNVETPLPASWMDYKEVPFGKFASGSYSFDYANKYVKIKCRFSGIAPELTEIPKYQRPSYMTFFITGVDSRLYSIRVVVSGSLADTVLKLEPQEEIALYGKAVQVDLHTLTLEVYKIER